MGLKEKWGWVIFVMMMMVVFGFGVNGCWGCLEKEKAALLNLKAVLKFAEPEYLASWKEDEKSDCCEGWEGVGCGHNKRVQYLSVVGNYFGGSQAHFNASILLPLQDLRALYLRGNGIGRWIESKGSTNLRSSLRKLERLDLSGNCLGSSIIQQLSGFHSLRNLSLRWTCITGHVGLKDIDAISMNLKELDLSDNDMAAFTTEHNETMKLATTLAKLELLDLSVNYKLSNKILSTVCALPSLKHLKLSDTGLTGQIQLQDIKAMTNLKELDLSWNSITGFVNYSDIEAMKNLEELDLSWNCITGFVNYNETMKLATFRKLELLDLSWNDELGNNILSTISALPSLKHLILIGAGLTGQIQLHDIEAMENLEELDLSRNSITGFVNYNDCGQMQTLQKLDLSQNELRTLPSCLANLSSLQKLDISYNQITGSIVSSPLIHLHSLESLLIFKNKFHISDSLKEFANHTKLKYLNANSNQVIVDDTEQDVHSLAHTHGLQLEGLVLSNYGLIKYPVILDLSYNLRYIDLSNNPLKGEFPKWLLENHLQMEVLFMRNNSLTGELHLPSFPHPHLSIIDISQNKLHGHIPSDIDAMFPQLEELYMSNNEFNGGIPSGLYDMESLSYLRLSDNQLSGGFGNLPKSHSHLCLLALSNNKLEGELLSFYGFPSLETLELEGNNFSGTIKPNFFTPSLITLNLGNNSLQGSIPKDFCGFYRLELLDLSRNMLNGVVPSCLFSLSAIEYLHLNDNILSGHITHAFDSEYANSLAALDLSHNDLSGEIPEFIGNFTRLSALILKGNLFNSSIPIELCKLNDLDILDLSNNRLSGPIPSCLSNLAFVGYIGQIGFADSEGHQNQMVENMGNPYDDDNAEAQVTLTTKSMSYVYEGRMLTHMSEIDLSCNRLAGEIPSGIGNLSNLQALNLSHNNLWGFIPPTFSNMKNIESLDLSYNGLDGSIPTQLLELDTLEVFTVAYNNLSGKIPNNAHFTTFEASSYEGNPLLCGFPLSKNCTAGELPSGDSNDLEDKGVRDDDEWIDMEIFYVSLAASSVTVFLVVLFTQWINPYWTNVLFYLAKLCVLSSYYFIQDTIRRFRRARN